MRTIARVMARTRFSDVRTEMGSMTALITCDLSDAFRADDPTFDYLEFWNIIAAAQRDVRP